MTEIIIALTAVIIISIAYMLRLRAASNKLALLQRVIQDSSEAVIITGPDSIITHVNPALCAITGYSPDELIGKNPGIMQSGRHDKEFYEKMWSALKETGKWSGEVWDKRKNGKQYPKLLTITAHKNKRGRILQYIGIFTDITEIKQSAEHIDFLLNHDNVTGLPNTALLNILLTNAMRSALQKNRRLALMTLKILRHKGIIEGFGFVGWNQLLKDSAKRLTETVGGNNIVARTGTDEFTIVIKSVDTPEKAAAFARKISDAMSEVIIIKGQYIHIGTCIGVSLSPGDTENPELLQIYSLRALATAHEKGINHFEIYSQEPGKDIADKFRVETNIRFALDNDEFVLHYQPQVSLKTGAIYGVEALIRRQEPNWLVPPNHFIGVAEETGLILDICNWTLFKACRQHMDWLKQGLPPVRVAVNASAVQFQQKKITSAVKQAIKETGISPEYLEIEVTERAFMHNTQSMIKELHALKDMGIALSIDDFGTGYSSLGYLRQFPVDSIKMDISFVREIGKSKDGETIARTIIELAHNLGFKALAEGVETKEQLDFLMAHHCDDMQGFYFSKPKTPELFAGDLRAGRKLF